jgi:hypothetical protein
MEGPVSKESTVSAGTGSSDLLDAQPPVATDQTGAFLVGWLSGGVALGLDQ